MLGSRRCHHVQPYVILTGRLLVVLEPSIGLDHLAIEDYDLPAFRNQAFDFAS